MLNQHLQGPTKRRCGEMPAPGGGGGGAGEVSPAGGGLLPRPGGPGMPPGPPGVELKMYRGEGAAGAACKRIKFAENRLGTSGKL